MLRAEVAHQLLEQAMPVVAVDFAVVHPERQRSLAVPAVISSTVASGFWQTGGNIGRRQPPVASVTPAPVEIKHLTVKVMAHTTSRPDGIARNHVSSRLRGQHLRLGWTTYPQSERCDGFWIRHNRCSCRPAARKVWQ
jgi:hypothetical protein